MSRKLIELERELSVGESFSTFYGCYGVNCFVYEHKDATIPRLCVEITDSERLVVHKRLPLVKEDAMHDKCLITLSGTFEDNNINLRLDVLCEDTFMAKLIFKRECTLDNEWYAKSWY